MYVKIKKGDKTELHHCKSYFMNQLKNGMAFNCERLDGKHFGVHVENGDLTKIRILNDEGKVIDKV